MTYYAGLSWVIQQKINEYENDINTLIEFPKDPLEDDKERIKQDQVIIQELTKILTGIGLERLSYV